MQDPCYQQLSSNFDAKRLVICQGSWQQQNESRPLHNQQSMKDPKFRSSADSLTRRTFMKTSALSLGAVAILSRGTALANGPVSSDKGQKKIEHQWGLIVIAHPMDSQLQPKLSDSQSVSVLATNHAVVGQLTLSVEATDYPSPIYTVTPAEKSNGIPDSKVKTELKFRQKGRVEYDGEKLSFMHANDAELPQDNAQGDAYCETPLVTIELAYYRKDQGPWVIGDPVPAAPLAPEKLDNPDDDAVKSISPGQTHMAMLGGWSDSGWSWIGTLHNTSNFQMTIPYVGNWTPGTEEGKTNSIVLIWRNQLAHREREMTRVPGGMAFQPANTVNDGWSKWMPI